MHLAFAAFLLILGRLSLAIPTTTILSDTGIESTLGIRDDASAWVGSYQNAKCTGPAAPGAQHDVKANTCYTWSPLPGTGWVKINYGCDGCADVNTVRFFTDDSCLESNGSVNYVPQDDDLLGTKCVDSEENAKSFKFFDDTGKHQNDTVSERDLHTDIESSLKIRDSSKASIESYQNKNCKGSPAAGAQQNIEHNTCYKWSPLSGTGWVKIDYGCNDCTFADTVRFFTDDSCTESNGSVNYVHQGENNVLTKADDEGDSGTMCVGLEEDAKSFMLFYDPDYVHQNDTSAPKDNPVKLTLHSVPGWCNGAVVALHNQEIQMNTPYNTANTLGPGATAAQPISAYTLSADLGSDRVIRLYYDAYCKTKIMTLSVDANAAGCQPIEIDAWPMCIMIVPFP